MIREFHSGDIIKHKKLILEYWFITELRINRVPWASSYELVTDIFRNEELTT